VRSGSIQSDDGRFPAADGNRAVFFDRDGVINKAIVREGKAFSPRTLEEFVLAEGVGEAVALLRGRGFKIIIITNQPELARGYISRDLLDRMTDRIRQEAPIDDLFLCPHDDGDRCLCRKPKPGMLIEAARKWGVDLKTSFFVGDTWKDMEAGKAAGCTTLLVDAVYNREVRCDFRVQSLPDAASLIINHAPPGDR
jgi:D-glycero-D-manno-heptose 1,7-bisphosphate phosphatase